MSFIHLVFKPPSPCSKIADLPFYDFLAHVPIPPPGNVPLRLSCGTQSSVLTTTTCSIAKHQPLYKISCFKSWQLYRQMASNRNTEPFPEYIDPSEAEIAHRDTYFVDPDDDMYRFLLNIADGMTRRGFGRPSNRNQGPNQQQSQQPRQGGAPSAPLYASSPLTPTSSDNQNSPTRSTTPPFEGPGSMDHSNANRKPPFFFREQYANLIVKGNFMTLAAKPVLVEEGEWLAHQGTSSYFLLVL